MGNQTQSLLADVALIPMIEPFDHNAAGIDSESIILGLADRYSIIVAFGSLTGDSVMKIYTGATVGTKTTAIDWSYRLSGADYKAAAADQFGAAVAVVAATGLTLTAASFDHRTMVIELTDEALASAAASKLFLTVEIDATATVLNVAAFAMARGARYQPAGSSVSTA